MHWVVDCRQTLNRGMGIGLRGVVLLVTHLRLESNEGRTAFKSQPRCRMTDHVAVAKLHDSSSLQIDFQKLLQCDRLEHIATEG